MWRRYFTKDFARKHVAFLVITGVYIVVGVLMLSLWFRWYINPDATSYFTLAQKYAHGNIRQAVNGYWGPLLSWLLVPFVWLHVELDFAARFISLLAGAGLLATVYRFLRRRGVSPGIVLTAVSITAIWSLGWVLLDAVTPDMLMAVLIVLFCDMLLQFMVRPSVRMGVALGALGGLMYYAKGFGLMLFVAVMGLVFLWQWLVAKEQGFRTLFGRYVPVALALGLLVLPYIAVISVKYHKPTISQAGDYNYRVLGPLVNHRDPETVTGPWNPPNSTAVSVWEQPIAVIDSMPTWSPLSSRANLDHFVQTIGNNLNKTLTFFKDTSVVYTLGAVALIAGCFQRKRYQREYGVLTGVTIVMILGYGLVLTEYRYLWAGALLALLGLALSATSIERVRALGRAQAVAAGVLFVAITLATFIQTAVDAHQTEVSHQHVMHSQIAELSRYIPKGSGVISDGFSSIYYCYYLHAQCYSIIDPPLEPTYQAQYYQRLKKQGVTYLIDYHSRDMDTNLQAFKAEHYTQVRELPGITVYKLH